MIFIFVLKLSIENCYKHLLRIRIELEAEFTDFTAPLCSKPAVSSYVNINYASLYIVVHGSVQLLFLH